LLAGWLGGVGFVDFALELLEEDEVGGVEAADLFAVPEELFETAVGVEDVNPELVLFLIEAVG
jgi:hypothetical protein